MDGFFEEGGATIMPGKRWNNARFLVNLPDHEGVERKKR